MIKLNNTYSKQHGFTLIEIMIAILLVAVIVNFAVPAYDRMLERNRLKAAAEEVYSWINYARSESIKQSIPLYMRFSGSGTAAWSFGVNSTAGGCTPSDALGGTSPCTITVDTTVVRKAMVNGSGDANFTGIRMSMTDAGGTAINPYDITFDQVRGTATAGNVILTSPLGWQIQAQVTVLGHVKLCSPAGNTKVAGYPEC